MITDNRCPKCGGADGHTPGCPNRQGNVRVSHTVHTTHHHACDCREAKVKRLVKAVRKYIEMADDDVPVWRLEDALEDWIGEFE